MRELNFYHVSKCGDTNMHKPCSWGASFEAKTWKQVRGSLIQYHSCTVQAKCCRSTKRGILEYREKWLTWRQHFNGERFHTLTPSDSAFHNFWKCIWRKQSDADKCVCTRKITAASFLRAKDWKLPMCTVIGGYINKLGVSSWKWDGYGLGGTTGFCNSIWVVVLSYVGNI